MEYLVLYLIIAILNFYLLKLIYIDGFGPFDLEENPFDKSFGSYLVIGVVSIFWIFYYLYIFLSSIFEMVRGGIGNDWINYRSYYCSFSYY